MTDKIEALVFYWSGEHMVPVLPRAAERMYVVGADYRLIPTEARSEKSNSHFFAAMNDVWGSLGHNMASRFPTATHLRKHALIEVGWVDEIVTACATNAEAERMAAVCRNVDDYAIVTVEGTLCTVYRAKSQKYEKMDRSEFQRSKKAALEWVADLIGVDVKTLSRNAGQSA